MSKFTGWIQGARNQWMYYGKVAIPLAYVRRTKQGWFVHKMFLDFQFESITYVIEPMGPFPSNAAAKLAFEMTL